MEGAHVPNDDDEILDRSVVSEHSFVAPAVDRARDRTKVQSLQEMCRTQIRTKLTTAGEEGAGLGLHGTARPALPCPALHFLSLPYLS